ncbi:hypothetical protein CHS0354_009384 [Potamilus streckersoni]|uniref:SYO1-like TPR repeats domain-containing protein n=1 Tax=Potamilus streckersoni TaxID=2493646 RepID=A0AAE0W7U9_9BIVA|nr:hypothetical protein CHS0354_009384 [Potamilus streckersoni]
MGKSKNKRFKSSKPCPTGLQSVNDADKELELSRTECIPVSLLEKLQSPSESERECGCTTIAGVVSQPGAIQVLMKQNIVKILAPLMLDPHLPVRLQAAGALRNLSVDGGPEICEEMVKKDVLTPLVTLIQQYHGGMIPSDMNQTNGIEIEDQKKILTESVHLLLNLCESSELAVSTFNKDGLVTVLAQYIHMSSQGMELPLAVAQCLHIVTEDNAELGRVCREMQLQSSLETLLCQPVESPQAVLLHAYVTGILVNIMCNQINLASSEVITAVVKSVSEVLSTEPLRIIQCLISQSNEVRKQIQDAENIVAAQQVCLEIITNLCCSEDDGWEDMNSESGSSDEEANVSMDTEENQDLVVPFHVPKEVHSAFVNFKIVDKVLQTAEPLSLEYVQATNTMPGGTKLVRRFEELHIRGMLCMNNLVSSLDVETLGGSERICTMWQGLLQVARSQHSIETKDILESVTSAMRAVVQKLAEAKSTKFSEGNETDLQLLYEMAQFCQWSEVRVNAIRIVCTIGCLLAKNTEPHPLLKDIGLFLIGVVCKDCDLLVTAEALDSIFDVFCEDHLDPIVREINLVDRLKQVVPAFKSKINGNKKNLGEHYPIISTAKTNLVRFIRYKSSCH